MEWQFYRMESRSSMIIITADIWSSVQFKLSLSVEERVSDREKEGKSFVYQSIWTKADTVYPRYTFVPRDWNWLTDHVIHSIWRFSWEIAVRSKSISAETLNSIKLFVLFYRLYLVLAFVWKIWNKMAKRATKRSEWPLSYLSWLSRNQLYHYSFDRKDPLPFGPNVFSRFCADLPIKR